MIKTVFGIALGITLTACFGNTSDHNRTGYFGGDYSRIYVPDSIRERYDMNQRFEIDRAWRESGDPLYHQYFEDLMLYEVFLPPNMEIREIFNAKHRFFGDEVDNMYDPNLESDKQKFAMYTVNGWRSLNQLVLLNKKEVTVVYMGNEYTTIIQQLLKYFEIHSELDERLLPLCVQEATRLYVSNCLIFDQYGPWRHWMGEQADSLGRIYNQYLYY